MDPNVSNWIIRIYESQRARLTGSPFGAIIARSEHRETSGESGRMIGLKRNTVQIVDYDPDWPALFASERKNLHRPLSGLAADVQHVGGTAVPGLPAKPILDIAIAVTTLGIIQDILKRLTEIGYIYRGDIRGDGDLLFVKESEPGIRTVHVHVVETSSVQWKNYLFFREILRNDRDIRKRYADFKLELAKQFPNDRESYTSAKDEFIRQVLTEEH
jgi:GrpB-like predicted nucleotidyltransferase (UPF0157 family)